MTRLYEVEQEFERIKRDVPEGYEQDMALNRLRSALERDHEVPVTNAWQKLQADTPAKELYIRISASRYLA